MVDMFAKEEFMLVEMDDVIQLLFVLTQSPLTQGLISLHHQLISSTSLSLLTRWGRYLCKENALHPTEYPRHDRTMDKPQYTKNQPADWQDELARWDALKTTGLCQYHQYQYLPVIIALNLPACSPCVVIEPTLGSVDKDSIHMSGHKSSLILDNTLIRVTKGCSQKPSSCNLFYCRREGAAQQML